MVYRVKGVLAIWQGDESYSQVSSLWVWFLPMCLVPEGRGTKWWDGAFLEMSISGFMLLCGGCQNLCRHWRQQPENRASSLISLWGWRSHLDDLTLFPATMWAFGEDFLAWEGQLLEYELKTWKYLIMPSEKNCYKKETVKWHQAKNSPAVSHPECNTYSGRFIQCFNRYFLSLYYNVSIWRKTRGFFLLITSVMGWKLAP